MLTARLVNQASPRTQIAWLFSKEQVRKSPSGAWATEFSLAEQLELRSRTPIMGGERQYRGS